MNNSCKRSFKSHTKVILICISLIGVFLLSACESSFFSKSPDKSTTSEPVNNEKQIDSEKEAEAPSDTTEQNNIFNANVWPSLEELEESSEHPQKVNENVSDTKRMYSVSTVNVRSGPSTDYKKLGTLEKDEEIVVTGSSDNGWYPVIYNGEAGYVYNDLLYEKDPVPETTPTATPEVKESQQVKHETKEESQHVTVPKEEDTEGNLVWVPTKGGKKYHFSSSCSGMKNPKHVTLEHAIANGYTACKKCC